VSKKEPKMKDKITKQEIEEQLEVLDDYIFLLEEKVQYLKEYKLILIKESTDNITEQQNVIKTGRF
jgi:hypothetical protein